MIDATKVVKVYSGRPGCGCGCRGKYSTNPATIKRIVKTMNEIYAQHPEQEERWKGEIAESETRLYFAYEAGDPLAD